MATRQMRGNGSVYARKDGRFEGAAYVPIRNGGRRRVRAYGATRVEANLKLQRLLEQARRGIPAPTTTWTLSAWLDYWMAEVVPTKNRPRTIELYESTIRLHIKPLLGSKQLKTLSVMDVQGAVNQLVRDGHSPKIVHKMRTVLSSTLGRAEREELLFRNVARLVDLPAYERKEIKPWSSDEATTFLSSARGHAWEPGYLLIIVYGLRRGEALGLRWEDVDFKNGCFHVRQQIQRIDGSLQAGPVKTSSGRRTLPLLSTLRDVLVARAALLGFDEDALNSGRVPTGLIVTSKTGAPVEPGNFARTFHMLSSRAGLPRITVHHTRHTAATLLKSLGVPARDAQLILGHSNVTTTQQLYQHGDIDRQRIALQSVEMALAGNPHLGDVKNTSASEDELRSVARSDVSRQTQPSAVTQNIDRAPRQEFEDKENRPLTGAVTANLLGGTDGARTHDTLLKRTTLTFLATLPTSVISDLHTRTRRHILGALAVKVSRQTVASGPVLDGQLASLADARETYKHVLTERLRRLSFPLNLLPDMSAHNLKETA